MKELESNKVVVHINHESNGWAFSLFSSTKKGCTLFGFSFKGTMFDGNSVDFAIQNLTLEDIVNINEALKKLDASVLSSGLFLKEGNTGHTKVATYALTHDDLDVVTKEIDKVIQEWYEQTNKVDEVKNNNV